MTSMSMQRHSSLISSCLTFLPTYLRIAVISAAAAAAVGGGGRGGCGGCGVGDDDGI